MKDGRFKITTRKHRKEAIKLFLATLQTPLIGADFLIIKLSRGNWVLDFQGLTDKQFEDLDSILSNL